MLTHFTLKAEKWYHNPFFSSKNDIELRKKSGIELDYDYSQKIFGKDFWQFMNSCLISILREDQPEYIDFIKINALHEILSNTHSKNICCFAGFVHTTELQRFLISAADYKPLFDTPIQVRGYGDDRNYFINADEFNKKRKTEDGLDLVLGAKPVPQNHFNLINLSNEEITKQAHASAKKTVHSTF